MKGEIEMNDLKDLQERFLGIVRKISRNNPKIKYPLMRMILDKKSIKTSKIVYELNEAEVKKALALAKFIADEREKLGKSIKGNDYLLYDNFLLHATKNELRLLWLFLHGKKAFEVAELMGISVDDAMMLKKKLIAKGAYLNNVYKGFGLVQSFVEEKDEKYLSTLETVWSADFDIFVENIKKTKSLHSDDKTASTIAAIYQRMKLATSLLATSRPF